MRSNNSKKFQEKHTGVNRVNKTNPFQRFIFIALLICSVFTPFSTENEESKKPEKKNMWVDEKAMTGGIVGVVIGIVIILMIQAYIPSMLAPVEKNSATAVAQYGDANWTALQASQTQQAQNNVSMLNTIPQVLTIVAILMVLTMMAI